MECPNCGATLSGEDKFCSNCGAALQTDAAAPGDAEISAKSPKPVQEDQTPAEGDAPEAAEEPADQAISESESLPDETETALEDAEADTPPPPPTPVAKAKSKPNTALIIGIVVLVLLLLCCCCVIGVGIMNFEEISAALESAY